MRFDFNFYSSLLLIFFVHGLVYAVLLYKRGLAENSRSDKWLSLFLLLGTLYIAPWMLGFAGWYDNQPYRDILFYTPLQHLFFMGPVIFFYVQSLLNPSFRFGRKQWIHFVPGILYLLYTAVVYVTDKLVLHDYYFLADGHDRDFDEWYQLTGFLSMLIYFIISIRYFSLYQKLMVQVVSYADTVLFRWMRNFLYAFMIMLILWLIFQLASAFSLFRNGVYFGYWWQYFSFAIILYYIAIKGYSNSIETKVPFRLNLLTYEPALLPLEAVVQREADLHITDAEIIDIGDAEPAANEVSGQFDTWKVRIESLLTQDKIYRDPELSLPQVAKQLNTNVTVVSRAINQCFRLKFNDLINQYRIDEVKVKLQSGEYKIQTLPGIAYDCGFNSKSTFNRAFKKVTGLTPMEYIAALEKNGSL